MDWELAVNHWPQFRDRVKGRWNQLTAEQLAAIAGDRQLLSVVIQAVYGIGLELAEQQIHDFESRNKDYRPSTTTTSKWRPATKKADENHRESTMIHAASELEK